MDYSSVPSASQRKDEEGVSIARTGEDAAILRRRLERPARVGRYAMTFLGAVTASAGVAFWVSTASLFGVALGVFGVFLVALGLIQHFLYRRDLEHWPTDVMLWPEGLELVLPNSEVRGVTWLDSDLALELVSRRAPLPAKREYLLLWLSDSKIPPVQLSEGGYERLAKAAADGGLSISQSRRGARADAVQVIQIRAMTPPVPVEVKNNAGTDG